MKAATIREFGDVNVFQIEELATPDPKPGNLLIKVLAAGVNRFEHYIREGSVVEQLPFPHVLGADASGEVAATGDGVKGFSIGDRVVPSPGYPLDPAEARIYPISAAPSYVVTGLHVAGTYAQFIEVPARWVLRDETGLSPELVATLPMVAATSVRAAKIVGEVAEGDKVLVQAGSSGVGSFQIQVAKALGAQVATTVRSESKAAALRALGADLVINSRRSDTVELVRKWTDGRGADIVIDNVGGDILSQSIDAVKPQGIVVAVGFLAGTEVSFDIRNFFFGQKQLRGSLGGDISDLQWALDRVRDGQLKPVLDTVLPLEQVAEAHHLVATNQLTGNVVLLPWTA